MEPLAELTANQTSLVTETLRVALVDAARAADSDGAPALAAAAALLGGGRGRQGREPHPLLPAVGTSISRDLEVGEADTAAAMGHPDPTVAVLGSPRISLWFELVASRALPDPRTGPTSVGVGILVHHLGRAEVGEVVRVTATVESVSGRRVTLGCVAGVGDRLVARGTHHRVLLDGRGEA